MKTQVANKRVVARLRGFEPPTSGSGERRFLFVSVTYLVSLYRLSTFIYIIYG